MASSETTREKLLRLLAHRPSHYMGQMIWIPVQERPTYNEHASKPANQLGSLNTLPLELVHMVFAMLDLHSLAHMSQTCHQGATFVASLPEYRDLMRHAPQAVAALGRTDMLRHHSAAILHAALFSTACVSCDLYGSYLHLPSAQRCCLPCLTRNQSFWVVPVPVAKKYFGFSNTASRQLSVLHSIPGTYYLRTFATHNRRYRLVSIGTAKQLAITTQAFNSPEHRLTQPSQRTQPFQYRELQFFQKAPLQPPGRDRMRQANISADYTPRDKYGGTASVIFPSLKAGGRTEIGLCCRGCDEVLKACYKRFPQTAFATHLFEAGLREDAKLLWSKVDLFEHFTHCAGARDLVPNLQEELRKLEAT